MDTTINLFFLIPLGVIGAICSYTDLKYGKIPNKWIGAGFIYGLMLFLLLFLYDRILFQNPENIRFISESLLNAVIALAAGYGLWHVKLWSAGDGKLFALYALLVPLGYYSNVYVAHFPSFNLLLNLFFPLLMVLMAGAFFTVLKDRKEIAEDIFKAGNWTAKRIGTGLVSIFKMFLDYVFIIIIIQNLFRLGGTLFETEVDFNPFLVYFLLLLIMHHFSRFRSKSKAIETGAYVAILGYCSFLIFGGNVESLLAIARTAMIFMVLIGLTRYVLDLYVGKKEIKQVEVRDLKKGMIPSKGSSSFLVDKMRIYKDGKDLESFLWVDASGFDEYQVKTIKEMFADDQGYKIEVHRTFPFAPFLFLSASISVATQSSFLIFLDKLFRYIVN